MIGFTMSKKKEWHKYLPKGKREQKKLYQKSILYGSAYWKDCVRTKERAVDAIDETIDVILKKKLEVKPSLAVILHLADEVLKPCVGVELMKEVIEELLEE